MKEVVIKIPDLVYESIIVGAEISRDEADVLFAIRQGTVLPKGHGDLVDRDELKKTVRENLMNTSNLHYENLIEAEAVNCGVESSISDIDDAQIVIPADKEDDNAGSN